MLDDVSLTVESGEIVCLLGPSGCGKSTLLRVIVGLEQGYEGTVEFAGAALDGVPVHQRGFGLMFQDFALFPHRTVSENVAFGLRMQRLSRAEIARRVASTLELVGLSGFGDRTIFALSGGERQRVALARSLAPEPRLLLLDEPLGALDRTLRERLTDELREIIKRVGLTSVYVTHDQVEAFAVADRVVVMNAGRVIQQGPPGAIYRQPATVFVARFLGFRNIVPATLVAQTAGTATVETAFGRFAVRSTQPLLANAPLFLVIRPEAGRLAELGTGIHGSVSRITFRGADERVTLRVGEIELELDLPAGQAVGDELAVNLDPAALTLVGE